MGNYEHEEGAIIPIRSIISHAENDGLSGLGFSSLGRIVHDVWGDKVKRVRRGTAAERQYVCLNLKRIKSNEKSVEHENGGTLSDKPAGVIVPKDWKIVEDNWNCITFTRLEKGQFDNRRAMTEVVVSQSGNSFTNKEGSFRIDIGMQYCKGPWMWNRCVECCSKFTICKTTSWADNWIRRKIDVLWWNFLTRRGEFSGISSPYQREL